MHIGCLSLQLCLLERLNWEGLAKVDRGIKQPAAAAAEAAREVVEGTHPPVTTEIPEEFSPARLTNLLG